MVKLNPISQFSLVLSLTWIVKSAQLPFLSSTLNGQSTIHPSLSDKVVQTFSHPSLPAHSLRITQPPGEICERSKGKKSWSGYLDVDVDKLREHKLLHEDGEELDLIHTMGEVEHQFKEQGVIEHFYFWAFESRSDASKDPVMLWLNGGPGCSSFTGLLMEDGPCNAIPGNKTEMNPWSWNSNATMVYFDQPVGTGFSYSSWSDSTRKDPAPARIYSAPAAARDASAFLQLFGMHANQIFSPQSSSSKNGISSFHISGESYAGRWIPLIASQLLRDNERAAKNPERGIEPLPLKSVLIGNGITSPKAQFPAYWRYACTMEGGHPPFFDEKQCKHMESQIPVCLGLVEKCNHPENGGGYNSLACQTASSFCEGALSSPWESTGRSFFDWAHMGEYQEEEYVASFLNDPKIREAMGIDEKGAGDKHDGVFVGCSDDVYNHFASTGDGARDSTWAVTDILEKGVRVLIYSGERDFICNSLGGDQWTSDLEWSGKEGFNAASFKPWYRNDGFTEAGTYRTFGNLTFTAVHESGHFLPKDQPEVALTMVNRWLHFPGNGTF